MKLSSSIDIDLSKEMDFNGQTKHRECSTIVKTQISEHPNNKSLLIG